MEEPTPPDTPPPDDVAPWDVAAPEAAQIDSPEGAGRGAEALASLAAGVARTPMAGVWRKDGVLLDGVGLSAADRRRGAAVALGGCGDGAAMFPAVLRVPILTGRGDALGCLCVMDHRRRRFTDRQRAGLATLAALARDSGALTRDPGGETPGGAMLEVRRLQAMFDAILDNTEALVFIKRRDGALMAANRKYRAVAMRDSVVGMTDVQLYGDKSGDALRRRDRDIFRSGEPFYGEETVTLPDGRVAHYLSSKFLIYDPGLRDMVLCAIATDITAQKALQRSLEQSRIEAEAANAARSQFLAAMSHEVRTPMNGILGMLALLATTALDDRQATMARVARDSAASLLGLLSDVLDYARLEANGVTLRATPFRVDLAITAVTAPLRERAAEKTLALDVLIEPEAPARINADAARFRQVLGNLVNNALKFTAAGGVTVIADRRGDHLRVTVRDTGVGVSAQDRGRIFNRFSQADATWTRAFGGVGLGLTISKLLVEAMGGAIGVDDAPGGGAAFWFTVPVDQAGDDAGPAPAIDPSARPCA